MTKTSTDGQSEVRILWHESTVLQGNPTGDPTRRRVYVYTPPGYDSSKKYPALMAVVGFTGTGSMLMNVDPFGEDLQQRMDRLITSGECPPCIVVMPDCFNRFGGSQYINSSAIGPYEDYLLKEIIPFSEKEFSISNWGVFGKSSGGYGSVVLAMRNPEVFPVFADHSGDANFELCYLPDFGGALDAWKSAGGPKKWLDGLWNDVNRKRKHYHKGLNILAMSAHYSPNPKSEHLGIDFPFDLETGEFKADVWERWKAWDPVQMVDRYEDNLKKLKFIFIDCGSKDEFNLQWGARALKQKIESKGVAVHYEEFKDGHFSISYRYDRSLPLLVKALNELAN